MEMTPQRWENTCRYLREVFGREDTQLATYRSRAAAAGLPDIAISADVGRLLMLLTSMTNGGRGASVAVEVGTLGGYSGIWIARGLGPGGRLYTIEPDAKHAAFARAEFAQAGLKDRVTQIGEGAPSALETLARRLGSESADVVFLDALKKDYPAYLAIARPMLKRGGLLLADNALGASWWIDDPPGQSPERDAVDAFNRQVAADAGFEACCVPIREGVLVARRL